MSVKPYFLKNKFDISCKLSIINLSYPELAQILEKVNSFIICSKI